MERHFNLHSNQEAGLLLGPHDEHLRLAESAFGIKTLARGQELTISGEAQNVERAGRLFEQLLSVIRKGGQLRSHDVVYSIKTIKHDENINLENIFLEKIDVSSKRQFVYPRTKGQKEFIDAIRKFDVVFAIGPAGTGKTYLAMAMAVSALKRQEVSRIILTRPAIEAGESLGYLPGDMYEKVNPYLRPLYDALYDMVEFDMIEKFLDRGIIEIAPLAYMRGRTLNDSFIILDEAQNSTVEQMKMFLTRLGFDSKTVITGDITQSDLPSSKRPSGLVHVRSILSRIEGIRFVSLTEKDVVRHELVQKIIRAYNKDAKLKEEKKL